LEKQTATSVSALGESFSWHGQGTCLGLVTEQAGQSLVRSPFWIPREWEQALHHRRSPLFLNQGYPLALDQEFEIVLPPKAKLAVIPAAAENRNGPLTWKIAWTDVGADKLIARFHAELANGDLNAEETKLAQQQLSALMGELARGASFAAAH
jgi:hypothetical protein